MAGFLLLLLPIVLFAQSVEYGWYLTSKGYFLKIKFPEKVCEKLTPKVVFLYLLNDGRVYKKTLRRKPKRCEVWKVIKNPKPLKVLIFYPQTLKVEEIKRIEPPKF